MFMGRWMRYRRERWQIQAKMTIVSIEWTVTQSIQWRSKLYSWRWRGPLDDGLWSMRTSGLQKSDKLQRYLRCTTRVTRRMACISDRSAASSSMHSIYKNQHPSLHFLCFLQKLHCQRRVRHLSERVRSTHLAPTLIRSLFSSVNDSIRSIYYTFSVYSSYGKNLSFLHPSPPFYFKPVSLRFCHYV